MLLVHSSVITMVKINELKFQIFVNLSYSQDLATNLKISNLIKYLIYFLNLKKWVDGQKFHSNKAVINAVNIYFERFDVLHIKMV